MDKIIMPQFIYGTAWKGAATKSLVKQAVVAGFVAIDTANQPKHYSEALVGDALAELQNEGIQREHLFLQTKFTPVDSQDERIPYDVSAAITKQVMMSCESSLQHLQTSYVDSYLLHGPYTWPGLGNEDWEAWRAIETIYESGAAKMIGVSNVNLEQLELLTRQAKIKPMVVQNRCYANRGWDRSVREYCKIHDIIYQGFSLLTANSEVLHHREIHAIATRLGKTPPQIVFRFALQIGMVPLTGTTSEQHMREDLQIFDFELTPAEVEQITMMYEH